VIQLDQYGDLMYRSAVSSADPNKYVFDLFPCTKEKARGVTLARYVFEGRVWWVAAPALYVLRAHSWARESVYPASVTQRAGARFVLLAPEMLDLPEALLFERLVEIARTRGEL